MVSGIKNYFNNSSLERNVFVFMLQLVVTIHLVFNREMAQKLSKKRMRKWPMCSQIK